MKKFKFRLLFLILPITSMIACGQKTPDYTVDFLVKDENNAIFKKLESDCLMMLSADKQPDDSIASEKNCQNFSVAAEKRSKAFSNPNNTKRIGRIRAFE